jgi:hypothetical protein
MNNDFIAGAPMPRSIGYCADLLHETRELRLAMQKQTDDVKARETEIREHIIATLSKSDRTGEAGLRYRAQIVTKQAYKPVDWGVLHSWIRKNDRFDFLQKRLADKAVADWVEENHKPLPGTEIINVPDVSITKI